LASLRHDVDVYLCWHCGYHCGCRSGFDYDSSLVHVAWHHLHGHHGEPAIDWLFSSLLPCGPPPPLISATVQATQRLPS
jgi:hypothetical protein